MKKQVEIPSGVLQYFLGALVQVTTDIEQHQVNEDESEVYAKLVYQGVLMDFDDNWIVLGYEDDEHGPVIVASIKLSSVIAVEVARAVTNETAGLSKTEVN